MYCYGKCKVVNPGMVGSETYNVLCVAFFRIQIVNYVILDDWYSNHYTGNCMIE